jgi:hypothetical protein
VCTLTNFEGARREIRKAHIHIQLRNKINKFQRVFSFLSGDGDGRENVAGLKGFHACAGRLAAVVVEELLCLVVC